MSELTIRGKKQQFSLSLLQFPIVHPSRETPGYAIRLNPKTMDLTQGPYFIALEQIFTALAEVVKKYKQLRIHIIHLPVYSKHNIKSNYNRILIFVSQRGKMDEQLVDILEDCQVSDTYLFSDKEISNLGYMVDGHYRIDVNQLGAHLIQTDNLEIGVHEFRHFMALLERIRKTMYIETKRSEAMINDGIYLGEDKRGYPVYIENMSNLLVIGSDEIIPSILNNRENLPAVVVTRNTGEWERQRNMQGGIQLLHAGDGLQDEGGEFGINLLGYCRKNAGLVHHLFQKLKIFTGGKYKDPDVLYELIHHIRKDQRFEEFKDLDFTSLLSGDMETDELWAETDLSLLTAKTGGVDISYGDVLHKPFLQNDRGDLEFTGITVIDTSTLSEFDHTLLCLVLLSLQETKMLDSWLVLSDFDLMDNKKFKSDLESLFYFSNANRLLLHFSRVHHMKSYYNKFRYIIFNAIENIPYKLREYFGILNVYTDDYILKNQFDDYTKFTPVFSIVNMDNILAPKRSVIVDLEELEENELLAVEETDEVEEEEVSHENYLEGAIISYMREVREYTFDEIVLHFEAVEEIDIPLKSLVEQDIVYHNKKYGLNNRYRMLINEMTIGISPSDKLFDDEEFDVQTGIGDHMLNMGILFEKGADKQIVADLVHLLNILRGTNKEVAFGFDLLIGLYREMLGDFDEKEVFIGFMSIINMIGMTLEKSGFDTGMSDSIDEEYSDDVIEMVREQDRIEEEKMREYHESVREDDNIDDDDLDDDDEIDENNDLDEIIEENEIEVEPKKELLVSEILKNKVEKPRLENQPIHPDRLKPRFYGGKAHGWVPTTDGNYSQIDDTMATRHQIKPDVFILTFIVLKKEKDSRYKSALGMDYQRERYIIPLNATIDDMVEERLISRKRKGIRTNDFDLRFGYRLTGDPIHNDKEYRQALSEIITISVDELEDFYDSQDWRTVLRNIRKHEKKTIRFKHKIFDQIMLLWRLTHYDTTMSDIDPIIMAIINLENLERKHLELLSIYFKLIHSGNQSIDKILEGTTVDNPRLRSVLNRILESINEIPEGKESEVKDSNPVEVEVKDPKTKDPPTPVEEKKEERGEIKIKTIPRNAKGLEMLKPHLKFKSDEKKVMSIPKAKIRISEEKVPLENFFEKKEKEEWEKFDLGKVIEESLKGPLEKFRKPKKVGLKLAKEVIDEIKSVETTDVIGYLGDVLGLVVKSLITEAKSMPLNLLVFIFNRSGYESMVATTPFTEGLVSTIELFDKGKRKEGVLSAFRDKIHRAVDDLVYNDLFVERLVYHSKNIREE